jgi:signal transduction histidine kinase
MAITMWIKKLFPKSITGQLLAIIITAIAALQSFYIIMQYLDDLDDEKSVSDYTLNHIVGMVDLLPHVTPEKYEQMIEFSGFEYLSFVYSSDPIAQEPDNSELVLIQSYLVENIGIRKDKVKASETYKLDPRFKIMDDGYDHQDIKKTIVSIEINEGGWLNVAMNIHDHFGYYSPFNLTISISLIIIAVSIFVLIKITRPLDHLTNSIEKFSNDFKVNLVKEEGPHDLKRAIRSFNTMQKVVSNHIEQRITALTALSHDIRTPLTSLRIKAELIDESSLKDGIISSVEKMENLTSSVIDFLKGSDTLIQKKPTDLKKLIETECIERQELGNPVIINALDDIIVNCDPDAINRALQNLIDNALKYGKSATISLSHDDDMADIIVEDNGEGIDKKQLSKVLEPFERIGKERDSEKGGFGLGLSIVNDIAKAHNGSIQLTNKIGGGIRASLKITLK